MNIIHENAHYYVSISAGDEFNYDVVNKRFNLVEYGTNVLPNAIEVSDRMDEFLTSLEESSEEQLDFIFDEFDTPTVQ